MQRFSPRSERSKSHIRLPSLGVLFWEDELPEYLTLRSVGSFFLSYQMAGGNRNFTLKGHTQSLTCSGTQGRSINLIGTWVRPTCWSCRVFQGERRQLQLTLRTQTLMAAILRSSFYHMDSGTGKHHCRPRTQPCSGPEHCRHQHLDISGQATNWMGTEPHSPAD